MRPISRPLTARAPGVVLVSLLAALLAAGCALTSKSEPVTSRYFTPERPGETARPAARPAGAAGELRLGRISDAAYLDDRLVYRDSDHEVGYYQERRWTEAPEQYLRRRLSRVLFEERGIVQVVGGGAVTLEVDLVAFEEIRAPRRIARVQVTARVHDQRSVRWAETLTVDQPVAAAPGDGADAAVDALGVALRAVVDKIAERVVKELAAPSASPPAQPR